MFLVSTCPYCQTEKIPFDIKASHYLYIYIDRARYNGSSRPSESLLYFNSFSICRNCNETVTFKLYYLYAGIPNENYTPTLIQEVQEILDTHKDESILSKGFSNVEIVTPPPLNPSSFQCPEHVPEDIKAQFDEAAQCHANDCIVASSIMLRLCLETVIKNLLKTNEEQEKKLFDGIKILSEKNIISKKIYNFAEEIRSDGNYAAHEGEMSLENLEDLFNFTIALLEDVYTQPKKLELSRERRAQRKKQGTEK